MSFAIHNGSVSKKEKILQLALKGPVQFGQMFLEKDFKIETASAYHYDMASMMDDKKNRKPTIYMIARGHAKTKLTQASLLKDICTFEFEDDPMEEPHFVVWVAQNKTQAMRNVNFIQLHAETNSKLRYYFGDLKGDGKWNQEELDFKNGCSLICRAGLHGIRGLLKDHLRPTRFLLDDFEYEGNTKTQHSRDSNASTVTATILPALHLTLGRMQINQTPVHYDSFVMRIWDNLQEFIKTGGHPEDFEWIVYKRSTSIENPLWSEYFNSERLQVVKKRLIQAGEINKWFQEYEMEVTTSETQLFGEKVLNYWEGEIIHKESSTFLYIESLNGKTIRELIPVLTFQGCDPASDIETRSSSYIAIVDIAVDAKGRIFVLDYLAERGMPDIALDSDKRHMGTSNQILLRCRSFRTRRNGTEKTALSSGVFNCIAKLKEESPEFADIAVVPLSHKGERKIDRIYNGLINSFNSQNVFIKSSHDRLEKEIKTFGEYAKYMDLLDALEMAKRVSYKPVIEVKTEERKIPMDEWEKRYATNHNADNWKTV